MTPIKYIFSTNSSRFLLSAYFFMFWAKSCTMKSLPDSIESHKMRDDSIRSVVVNYQQPETNFLKFENTTKQHRFRRETTKGGWNKLDLTWSFDERTLQLARLRRSDATDVIRSLSNAFDVWSHNTCLRFHRVNSNDEADMKISFQRGDHGDARVFSDKIGGAVAHAHPPGDKIGGDIHFNADLNWKLKPCDNTEGAILQSVAVHEIGHALGLKHSENKNDIMFFVYFESSKFDELSEEDLRRIEQMYGNCRRSTSRPRMAALTSCGKEIVPKSVTPTNTERNELHALPRPNICKTDFDAITMFRGQIWIFKNQYSWRIDRRRVDGPSEITQYFKDLSTDGITHIDAAFETESSGIMFFIGKSCYFFDSSNLDRLYRKYTLIELGLPTSLEKIDAVLRIDSPKRVIYFLSGRNYWEFDENTHKVKMNQPQLMDTHWQGISNVNGAFQDSNRMIYFLRGNKFIEFNTATNSLTNRNQISIAQWADGCPPDMPINSNNNDERQKTRKRIDEGIVPWRKDSRKKIVVTTANRMNDQENMDHTNDTISNDSWKISTNKILLLYSIVLAIWNRMIN